MHDLFLRNAKTSRYAWNSAPINDTDIIRSVAAVIQELRSPLDVKILQIPTTLNQGNSGLYEYLWHVSNNSQFTTSILHTLINELRIEHRERWNQKSILPQI